MARKIAQRKLVDRLASEPAYGPLQAVLATTYELDPTFIETDFLPAVLGLGAWDDRSWASRIALERALAGLEAVSILTDLRKYRGRPRSLHVEVVPAVGAPGQLLHAKVLLLVHENAVRLQAGSANLTDAGYRHNREVVLPLVASEGTPEVAALVRSALREMPALLGPWWSKGAERVRALADEKLSAWAGGMPEGVEFVWGGGEEPIWKSFLGRWPKGERVGRLSVVSPFWSEEGPTGPFTRLVGALQAGGMLETDAEVTLYVEAEPGERGGYRPRLPALGRFDPASLGLRMSAVAVDPRPSDDGVGEDVLKRRALHAKVVVMEGPRTTLAYVGSANFTTPGWGAGEDPRRAHIEAGFTLALAAPDAAGLLPPTTGRPVVIDAGIADVPVPEMDAEAAVPTFLRDVRLEPEDDRLRLLVAVIPEKVHGPFHIALHGDVTHVLLESGSGCAAEHRLGLEPDTLRKLLRDQQVTVSWWEGTGPSDFPVNVDLDARAALPVGPGDGKPGEHLLLQYYQGRIAYPDLFPPPPGYEEDSETLHSPADETRVDTSRIQSYQVREFVEALQGIRDDIRAASIGTRATMRLALFGPVSPIALARQIRDAALEKRRSPTAAGFQLVEIAGCLPEESLHERVSPAWGPLVNEARQKVESFLEQIAQLYAEQLGPKTTFQRYAEKMLRRKASTVAR
jgi:hypothetical protein